MSSPQSSARSIRRTAQPVNGWLIVILLIIFSVLVYRWAGGISAPLHDPLATSRVISPRGDLSAAEKSQVKLFRAVSPSVVHITSLQVTRDRISTNLFEIPRGSGSGFVWDTNGNIVTNFHVVKEAVQHSDQARVTVTFADNSTYDAEFVGAAPQKDLAVLKIDAPQNRLTPIAVGTSSDLARGQNVFAIGSPFRLDQTLTTGIVSGLGREIQTGTGRPIWGVIQTDAAINPGNSGGPLLDSAGRLIGVNTAIYSPSGAYAGVGFSIPVDTINRIVPQLIRHGKVELPGLGIAPFTDSLVESLLLRGVLPEKGVLVKQVGAGSASERAGILPTRVNQRRQFLLGDLIVAIDDQKIENTNDLFKVLDSYKVGDSITVTVFREEAKLQLSLRLQELR